MVMNSLMTFMMMDLLMMMMMTTRTTIPPTPTNDLVDFYFDCMYNKKMDSFVILKEKEVNEQSSL